MFSLSVWFLITFQRSTVNENMKQYYSVLGVKSDMVRILLEYFLYGLECEALETNQDLQSLDVVAHAAGGRTRWLCYIRFLENNTYHPYPGINPAH